MRVDPAATALLDQERMSFPFEKARVEFRTDAAGKKTYTTIEGYASTWRTIDALGEEMVRGAFTKTVQERVPARRVKLIDGHGDDCNATLGTVVDAKEDATGLWIRAEVSATEHAQHIAQLVDEGHLKWFSIGFRTIREEFIAKEGWDWPLRRILEAKLYEVSIVPFPADEECDITAVRSVVPFQDLPLAPAGTPWDAAAARARVLEASGGRIDAPKFRKAFAWSDKAPGCQLAIADLVDGKLMVVPAAVLAADLTPVPESARSAVREHLARYMDPIRKADPGAVAAWEQGGCLEDLAVKCRSGVSDEACKTRVLAVLGKLPDQVRQELAATLTAAPPPPGARTVDEGTATALARARALSLSLTTGG